MPMCMIVYCESVTLLERDDDDDDDADDDRYSG